MSILIKGIDLPKETDGMSVTFHTEDGAMETHIFDVSQAIQIPTPHGRLIDADKVFTYDYLDKKQLTEVPTVLEAEGEKQ